MGFFAVFVVILPKCQLSALTGISPFASELSSAFSSSVILLTLCEWKYGVRNEGLVATVSNYFTKLANAVTGLLSGHRISIRCNRKHRPAKPPGKHGLYSSADRILSALW